MQYFVREKAENKRKSQDIVFLKEKAGDDGRKCGVKMCCNLHNGLAEDTCMQK